MYNDWSLKNFAKNTIFTKFTATFVQKVFFFKFLASYIAKGDKRIFLLKNILLTWYGMTLTVPIFLSFRIDQWHRPHCLFFVFITPSLLVFCASCSFFVHMTPSSSSLLPLCPHCSAVSPHTIAPSSSLLLLLCPYCLFFVLIATLFFLQYLSFKNCYYKILYYIILEDMFIHVSLSEVKLSSLKIWPSFQVFQIVGS